MSVSETLKTAVNYSGLTVKAVANRCNYSTDALYLSLNGSRPIPAQARQKLASLNIVGMMATTLEATGLNKLFGLIKGDRHVLTMFHRAQKEDMEADKALATLPELIIDNPTSADLSPAEIQHIQTIVLEVAERINADINLLAELERQYGFSATEYLQKKEKTA